MSDKAEAEESSVSLEDVLEDDSETETVKAEPVKANGKDKTEEAETESEEETETEGAEKPTGEKASSPEAKNGMVPEAALLAERRKRQAAEAELSKAKGGNKAEDEGEEETPAPDPNAKEDPLELRFAREKIAQSRSFMLELKPDYEEKEKVFLDLVKTNPALIRLMRDNANPAKFAYQTAVNHLDAEALADPKKLDELREQIREEERAKLKAEADTPDAKRKKSASEVANITSATAVGKTKEPVKKLELEDMLVG